MSGESRAGAGAGEALEFRRVGAFCADALAAFFREIRASGSDAHFHPHPFTDGQAHQLAAYTGRDLYYVALVADRVLAYGMLRGWDEGFAVPSLGIAVAPASRGLGLGRATMLMLHGAARVRGATRVRLKVHPDNTQALALYRSLGYRFDEAHPEQGQWVGIIDL